VEQRGGRFIPYLKTAADFIRSKMQAADEKIHNKAHFPVLQF
jgi:hypothetical protein